MVGTAASKSAKIGELADFDDFGRDKNPEKQEIDGAISENGPIAMKERSGRRGSDVPTVLLVRFVRGPGISIQFYSVSFSFGS